MIHPLPGTPGRSAQLQIAKNSRILLQKLGSILELGTGPMCHLGSLVPPKCMSMLGYHRSTTGNPWQERAVLNCENQPNFAPKISFNLKQGSGVIGHQGKPVPPKCTFIISDHISTTGNPWRECAAFDCENQQNFTPKI
jgi:hypothetical protein